MFPVMDKKAVKEMIDNVMANRDPTAAKRIELDNVIKVVGANEFGKFVMEKLVKFFPEWNYNRVISTPSDYFAERFHILPPSTKEYFNNVCEKADTAAAPKEEEII